MGAELFYADEGTKGHTNMTKPIIAFRVFVKAFKCSYKNKYPYITSLFLIYYIVNSFVI
jgi:hypothetical protein